MTILFQDVPVSVWEINQNKPQPDWVKKCFKNNAMVWYDNRLKILVKAINPSSERDVKLGLRDTMLGYYGGGCVMANVGDYFDATNGRVISKKKFYKQYVIE